ncbi:MAG: hypothetical protein KatS3mg119_1470 [Rhodothalassiaceae bacterium]|nr:MAG: hypothetical protein KatS3mg119_1470 [Rhodothalassiaceae bacterium]
MRVAGLLAAVLFLLLPGDPARAQRQDPFLFDRAKQVGDAWLDRGVLWSAASLAALERAADADADPAQRRRRLILAARMAMWLGDYEQVEALLARVEAEARDEVVWQFAVAVERALMPSFEGRGEEAERRLAQLDTRFDLAALSGPARIWFDLAKAHAAAGANRPQVAIRAMAEAAGLIAEAPPHLHRGLTAVVLLGYGEVAASFLDLGGVVQSYDGALQLADALPGPPNAAEVVYHIANLLNRSGQHEAARLLFSRLVALGREQDSPRSVFLGEYGLMKVWHNLGDPVRSDEHAEAALAAWKPRPLFMAAIAQHRALNALSRGDLEAAKRWHAQGESLMRSLAGSFAESEYASFQALIAAELASAEGRGAEAVQMMRRYARVRSEAIREIFQREAAFVLSNLLGELEKAQAEAARERIDAQRETERLQLARRIMFAVIAGAGLLLALFWYQRRTAKALARVRREAEEANRRKDAFLASMSHELRTPLNAIIGFAEWAGREPHGPFGDPRYREHFHSIARSGRHLLDVISDLIEATERGERLPRLEESAGSLADDIAAAIAIVDPQATARRKRIRVELPENLPDLNADHRMLRQILINLLSNAIKYAADGTAIHVTASPAEDGGIAIAIRDEGPGMDPRELAEARERFGRPVARRGRAAGEEEGYGLGLAIVDELVRAHGGSWDIESTPGRGTTVTVRLPPTRLLAA